MNDLTIIYITANKMPKKWMDFQISHLLKSVKNTDIISISREKMNLGFNYIENDTKCYWNIYHQLLRGSKLATTPYIAMAEDDTLYTSEHFSEFRPELDEVAYDRSRWSLFVWEREPFYCLRQRISNCSLIASREYLIDALSEREDKYPQGNNYVGEVGRHKVEKRLNVSLRKSTSYYSNNPIIQLNHPMGTDKTQQRQWKKHGQIKAFDIPYWGKAKDIIKIYEDK